MKRKLLWLPIIVAFAINFILANIGATSSQSLPVIAINPKVSSLLPTQTFTINVTISDVTLENTYGYGVTGWEVDISFNSTVLNVLDAKEGPWLKTWLKPGGIVWWIPPKIDNTAGTVILAASQFPPQNATGALGSGTLANITFTVMNKGRSNLHFYKTLLRAYTGSTYLEINHSVVDGFFQYPVGDVNGDGKVDVSDLLDWSKAYGSHGPNYNYPGEPASPNWNPNCDFNKDNKVDASDLFDISKNYGKS